MTEGADPCGDQKQEHEIPDIHLIKLSVFLAVFLEVLGVEAGAIYGGVLHDIFLILVVKVTCLTVIFLPLVIYVRRNGLRAPRRVCGRVTIVAVIVAINLAHNILILGAKVLG